jgi:uncharacterized protein (DUF58 family)
MWGVSVNFHDMENTRKGWVHHEKGAFCVFICFMQTLTFFQLTRIALERSIEKRAAFSARIGTYEPEQLVFVDESAVDRRTTYRGHAWAIKGRKASRKAFFCRGRRSIQPLL